MLSAGVVNMLIADKFKITYVTSKIPKSDAISVCGKLQEELPVEFNRVESIQDIFPILSNPHEKIDSIAIDIDDLYNVKGTDSFDIIRTLHTLINCTVYRQVNTYTSYIKPQKRTTRICIIIPNTISKSLLKEILAMPEINDVCLRFEDNIDYKILKKCIENHISDSYERVPKFIMDILKNQNSEKTKSKEIILTTRQKQIYDIISKRGVSNKYIAKMLNITESTVKLHVGSLLKKYGVKNRTQLAVFAKNI